MTIAEFLVSLAVRFERVKEDPRTDAKLAIECRNYALLAMHAAPVIGPKPRLKPLAKVAKASTKK